MPPIDAALATVDSMKPQDPVQTLPEVGIADRNQLSKQLPPPAVLTPLRQTVLEPLFDVAAARDHSDSRGLIE